MTRTPQQNKSIHVDCEKIAEKLNDAGLDMRVVLKPEINIPWTKDSVKEYLWRPIQKAMYQKESTTTLSKIGEIEHIHNVLMRELGEKHGVEWHDFPHDPDKQKSDLLEGMKIDMRHDPDYPDEELTPTI